MCIYIDPSVKIQYSKRLKRVKVFKVLCFDVMIDRLVTPYCYKPTITQILESSREKRTLEIHELETTVIQKGIHVFLDKASALRELAYHRSTDNQNQYYVVECWALESDFIGAGTHYGLSSAAFMKVAFTDKSWKMMCLKANAERTQRMEKSA